MQVRPLRFTPVPVKARHDGWTPARQRAFIEALAATRCVVRACKAVGMSTVTAYALRKRAGAQSFAAAWDTALAFVPGPDRTGRRRRNDERTRHVQDALPQWLETGAPARKANEIDKVDGPPGAPHPPVQVSPALRAYLSRLRGRDQRLGSAAED
jgi:hypothetical protein